MFPQNVNQKSLIRRLPLPAAILALGLIWCLPARVQAPVEDSNNYILLAQGFLKATYPDLKNKHLVITIISDYSFDLPAGPMRKFELYVGEGKKDRVIGYIGGTTKDSSQNPPVLPGPVYPKQYLATGFNFDETGRLLAFAAEGEAIKGLAVGGEFREAREGHPEWTDAQVLSEFRQKGAQYGPPDKEKLLKNLPVDLLERYLGKLTVESAEFKGINHDALPPGWWSVRIRAKDRQGRQMKYTLLFEPFKGSLMNITVDEPSAAAKRCTPSLHETSDLSVSS